MKRFYYFFKNILNIFWKYCLLKIINFFRFLWDEIIKHPREDFIIILTIGSIIIAAVSFRADEVYRNKERIVNSSPFFKYSFSESQQSFLIETEEDVNINSTQWFFPYTDKTFYSIPKNSNSITIDEILSVIWLATNKRKVLIPSPDLQTNSYGYFRCEILSSFDEYNSGIEKDAGFPATVLIEYFRKGESVNRVLDLILIREFEDPTPQIRSIKTNATENELKEYMKKGMERLNGILNSNKYDENQKYIDGDGKCTRSSKLFKEYFFNKEDEEEFKNEMKKLLGE